MFYSHVYLRRNGRFGLVWLAATQSRVLNKRELFAINVSMTVTDILQHIPGHLSKDVSNRPRRFSLYLSSQLMYGSVKVLQKQWEYLLGDLTTLLRKFHPEHSSTNEIDLVIRQDPVTLESCVPTSMKDKYYDPFFGAFKENTTDIEALLATWNDDFLKQIPTFEESSAPFEVKPEFGSPNSVSDSRQIQIPDFAEISSEWKLEVPGEQDLPFLDAENLALIQTADQQIDISIEELVTPSVSRILVDQDVTLLSTLDFRGDLAVQMRPIEETPAVKTARELPGTPQKPKRKHRDNREGGRKKLKNLDTEETGYSERAHGSKIVSDTHTAQEEVQQKADFLGYSCDHQLASPETIRPPTQDWLQTNTSLQLTTLPVTPSPVRKRQPHKLIVDEILQLSRLELKKNMTSSTDTSVPVILPSTYKDFFKDPGSEAVSHLALRRLWSRNCKFGLRVVETGKESSSDISPLASPRAKRKESTADHETPAKLSRAESMLSGPASIEKRRDYSASSAADDSRERSKSLIGQASDDSTANISVDQAQLNLTDHEKVLEISLAPLPEEQEQIISPGPLQVPAEIPQSYVSGQQPTVATDITADVQSELLRLVREKVGQQGDWTTFKTICPPESSSRLSAIHLFQELCNHVAFGALCVRQDRPYDEIFIWEPNETTSH